MEVADCNHRFDGYRHSGNESGVRTQTFYIVVRNLGSFMHLVPDAVTDIVTDHRVAASLDIFLYCSADIAYAVSALCKLDALEKALSRYLDEPFGLVGDLAAGVSSCAVADIAAKGRSDINGDYVAVAG